MKPEISHRCPSCGASVREPDALFCRECGKPLSKAKDSQPAEAGEVSASAPAEVDESEETKPAEQAGTESHASEPGASAPRGEPDSTQPNSELAPTLSDTELVPEAGAIPEAKLADPPDADVIAGTQPAARRGDKTRERLHRASGVARGVTRGVMKEPVKQVEKIRHVSSVVIEEASYDPSLRFVLVALGLFVVFVVLLVLSKVMG